MNRKKDYKDLTKWKDTCKRQNLKYYRKTQKYERRHWTNHEDKLVLERTMTDTELSEKIKRSVKAIQLRRHRLKRT